MNTWSGPNSSRGWEAQRAREKVAKQLNSRVGDNENEDLELVIDEDFSSDVQNDINDDDERNICLHIPLKKRGKFSCNNCSLRKELKNVYTNMYSEKNI